MWRRRLLTRKASIQRPLDEHARLPAAPIFDSGTIYLSTIALSFGSFRWRCRLVRSIDRHATGRAYIASCRPSTPPRMRADAGACMCIISELPLNRTLVGSYQTERSIATCEDEHHWHWAGIHTNLRTQRLAWNAERSVGWLVGCMSLPAPPARLEWMVFSTISCVCFFFVKMNWFP